MGSKRQSINCFSSLLQEMGSQRGFDGTNCSMLFLPSPNPNSKDGVTPLVAPTTKFTFDSTADRPAAMTCFKKPRLQYSSTEKQVGFSWEVQQMFLYPVTRLYQVTSLPMFRAPSVYLLTLLLLISCTLAT